MPTPFTHLLTAQRLLADPLVPAAQRALLTAQVGAFLLGGVVADAQGLAGISREQTHFYNYEHPISDPAWRTMLARYPALRGVRDPGRRAFLAGYVMHISMDEIWSLEMTGPQFARGEWAEHRQRFLMLHILLIYMDERDRARLDEGLSAALSAAEPDDWLPFLSDTVIRQWRDVIAPQIQPGGVSETLDIYGARLGKSADDLRAILDSPERMQAELWANVPPSVVAAVEDHMTEYARDQMVAYLGEG